MTWTSLTRWWVTGSDQAVLSASGSHHIKTRFSPHRPVCLVRLSWTLLLQGQTAFDVADEDVLGYLEELQKKQNQVSGDAFMQYLFVDASDKPPIESVKTFLLYLRGFFQVKQFPSPVFIGIFRFCVSGVD